jgi:hypothetical protein
MIALNNSIEEAILVSDTKEITLCCEKYPKRRKYEKVRLHRN